MTTEERQAMIAHLRRNGWLAPFEEWPDASLVWLNDRTPREVT